MNTRQSNELDFKVIMKLSKYKEEAQYFTEKLSEINRYLSFAGIAIIWIFKNESSGQFDIPNELILPLVFLTGSLILDFLQYIYGATVWTIFFRHHENKKKNNPELKKYKDDDIKAPKALANISYFGLFYPKVIVNLIGYIILIMYLCKVLKIFNA